MSLHQFKDIENLSDDEKMKIRRFEEFHKANPHVYGILVDLANEWVTQTGRSICSITLLYNKARWDLAISTDSWHYVLNNDFAPFYARMIMWNEPDLFGIFHTRKSVADKWVPKA